MVKTRPRGKHGRARTSGRKGRPDGNFPPISSFMTSLSGIGPSKEELKLRATRRSGDPKKIEEVLS
jgi:hypothetical protein